MIDEGSIWIRSYHRLIESVDLAQVLALDKVPPDYIDKGVYCLHAWAIR
jgi:hypothetical protein